MKKAWQNPIGTIRDVCESDPEQSYHPDIAKLYTTDVPDSTVNGATLVSGAWVNPAPPPPVPPPVYDLAGAIKTALLKIDADTDAIYGAILGNRAEEYTSASDDAAAHKAANYTGTVPPGVQSWATAKGWTATAAANDILATTTAWVTAQNGIRATRLARKEQVRAATDAAGISTVLTAWAGFVVYMRGQLGL